MSNFTRKPVSVYRWDDADAPQIDYATPGALKTVLKACLSTGYGNKTALGWDVIDEDATRIAVRSADLTSTQAALWVDDGLPRHAVIRAYAQVSDLDTVSEEFTRYNNKYIYFVRSRDSGGLQCPWIVVGHDTAVIVIVDSVEWGGIPQYFYFGDFCSFLTTDQYGAILTSLAIYSQDTPYIREFGLYVHVSSNGEWVCGLMRDYKQAVTTLGCVNAITTPVVYPDPITGGWIGSPAYIKEASGHLRGFFGGLTVTTNFNHRNAFAFGETMPASQDTTDDFIWIGQKSDTSNYGFVVNATAWMA